MLLSLSHPIFGFPGGHEANAVPMAKTQLSRKGKDEGDETFSCGQGETQESSLVTVTLYVLVPNPLLSLLTPAGQGLPPGATHHPRILVPERNKETSRCLLSHRNRS